MTLGVGKSEEPLAESVQTLARVLFAGQSADATMEAVAHLAQQSIPACDAASITVMEAGKPRTAVSTGQLAMTIDERQYATDNGPCLDAVRHVAVMRVDFYQDESRWPELVPLILEQGVQSSLSLPLIAASDPVGALNMYSRQTAGFAAAEPGAEIFATQAAMTLANAVAFLRATELAEHLTLAMEHRDVIGQAKGILMAREKVSAEAAFDMLRRASQRSNRKLYELAIEIVDANNGRLSHT